MAVALPTGAVEVGGDSFSNPFAAASADVNYQITLNNNSSVVADCVVYLVIDGATSAVSDAYKDQWLAGYTRRSSSFKTLTGLSAGSHTWAVYVVTASAVGSSLTTESCGADITLRGA